MSLTRVNCEINGNKKIMHFIKSFLWIFQVQQINYITNKMR